MQSWFLYNRATYTYEHLVLEQCLFSSTLIFEWYTHHFFMIFLFDWIVFAVSIGLIYICTHSIPLQIWLLLTMYCGSNYWSRNLMCESTANGWGAIKSFGEPETSWIWLPSNDEVPAEKSPTQSAEARGPFENHYSLLY